jgi:hypothetical protein
MRIERIVLRARILSVDARDVPLRALDHRRAVRRLLRPRLLARARLDHGQARAVVHLGRRRALLLEQLLTVKDRFPLFHFCANAGE